MALGVGLGYQPADSSMFSVPQAEGVRQWFQSKQTGWYAVLEDPRMPVTSILLDQAHNALDRKLCMIKGFNHP